MYNLSRVAVNKIYYHKYALSILFLLRKIAFDADSYT